MSQLTNSMGSQYSDEDRLRAATEYSVHGSIIKASEYTGIPSRTLYDWSHTDWWKSEVIRIREENKEIIRAKLSLIVEDGFNAIHDRMMNGDAYLTKDGEIARKPASLRDLGTVTGISFDKLRLLNNEPTSISGSDADALAKLKADFAQLATKKLIESDDYQVVTCDGEVDLTDKSFSVELSKD